MIRYCELCHASDLNFDRPFPAVLLDGNMETEMCRPCITLVRDSGEMEVEVLDELDEEEEERLEERNRKVKVRSSGEQMRKRWGK